MSGLHYMSRWSYTRHSCLFLGAARRRALGSQLCLHYKGGSRTFASLSDEKPKDVTLKDKDLKRGAMCSLTKHGRVYVLQFSGRGDHRLSPALLTDVMIQLEIVNNSEDAGALVTTNEGKFYSNGLDLEWVNVDSQTRGPILYKQFEELLLAILNMKVPTIAAVCGHAAAGGLALAMAHDHRFMRADRGFLYSSALDVNVQVPAGTLEVMASKMSPRAYRDAVLKCVKFTGKMALEAELIDGLYDDAAKTLEAAMKEAEALAARNWDKNVYLATRRAMYSGAIKNLEKGDSDSFHPVAASLKGFR